MTVYYLRADGTAANKAAATGPTSDASKCMSIATHNSETFSAGDVLRFSDKGGQFTAQLYMPSSGDVGNPIIYEPAPGEEPTWNHAAVQATIWCCTVGGSEQSNVTIRGRPDYYWPIANTHGVDYDAAIRMYAAGSNVTLQYLDLTCPGATLGLGILGANQTNLVIEDCIGTIGHSLLSLTGGNGLTMRRCTADDAFQFLSLSSVNNITLANCVPGNSGAGNTYFFNACGGSLAMTDCQAYTDINGSVQFTNCNFTAGSVEHFRGTGSGHFACLNTSGITIRDSSLSHGGHFSAIGSSYNITFERCATYYGNDDGFDTANTAHDIDFVDCLAWFCGPHNVPGESGTQVFDGFSSHDANYNINYLRCRAIGCAAGGFTHVGTSAGTMTDCLAAYCGGDYSAEEDGQVTNRGGICLAVTGANAHAGETWIVRRCVSIHNYPREVCLTAAAAEIVDMDFNDYYAYDPANFASLTGYAGENIDWATYRAREPHSKYRGVLRVGTGSQEDTEE